MSGGGGGAPFNPSGGPIDNQQRLQTSPNPSLPPADYSMGYARNFQPPSFFNPFSGYSGANTGMGGFQSQFGGFQQPQFGGFGGFGGFQQPQYGGFQQPQYGGFQQPQYGGFQQPQFGGLGGFQQPFGGGFGGQSNRFTRRGQEYTQPYNPPQPNQPDYGNMNRFAQPQPQPPQMPPDGGAQFGGGGMPDYAAQQRDAARNQLPTPTTVYYAGLPKPYQTKPGDTPFGMGAFSPEAPPGYTPGPAVAATRGATQPSAGGNMGGSLLSSLTSTGRPTTPSGFQRSDVHHTGAYGPNFGGGGRGQRLDDGAYGYGDGMGAYGGDGGFNPMMGGLGGFGGYGMPNREPVFGDSRMERGLRQADMRTLPQVPQGLVPPDYSVLADLARANGISGPMMTLEESTQGTGNYTGRATDYYKQQLGAKNIDFGESALSPYRQKIIDNMKNVRMRNA